MQTQHVHPLQTKCTQVLNLLMISLFHDTACLCVCACACERACVCVCPLNLDLLPVFSLKPVKHNGGIKIILQRYSISSLSN